MYTVTNQFVHRYLICLAQTKQNFDKIEEDARDFTVIRSNHNNMHVCQSA